MMLICHLVVSPPLAASASACDA